MVAKVGASQTAAPAPVRGGAAPVASTPLHREVGELSGSNGVGPEEQSLRFGDRGEQEHERFPERRRQFDGSSRFGELLTSYEVSGALVEYRSHHDFMAVPPLRVGAGLYEKALQAIRNHGVMRPLGSQFSRLM